MMHFSIFTAQGDTCKRDFGLSSIISTPCKNNTKTLFLVTKQIFAVNFIIKKYGIGSPSIRAHPL